MADVNETVETEVVSETTVVDDRKTKSKIAAGLFHLFLGDIGVGNFYMGKIGLGILDVLFFWTAIPGIVNLIRGILVLTMSDEKFEQKYNVKVDK